ncbi:MAG: 2,6-beta-D-fructofuranosidase [Prevotella sp.]|nr:2,6-beta-D-fructofuranosidase [Prevotella sp.]
MKKVIVLMMLLSAVTAGGAGLKVKVSKRYLNFPVAQQADRKAMSLTVDGKEQCRFVVRLTAGKPDYWVFQDVTEYMGQTLVLTFDGSEDALKKVYQDDTYPGEETIYEETYRPQYHFTTRRGWINDPNGLVYDRSRGEYHLFYQHNPFEREWENMHWGHAVSTDLLHWQELPDALHPDTIGTIFSGSAWMDYDNAAGFNIPARKDKRGRIISPEKVAMIVYYTADHPKYQRQCMAYSLDGGRTFTKYEGNPVIDSHERWQSHDTRDPKIFASPAAGEYVLVLNERDGHTIYNSTDLKHWTPTSHIEGFWECPELFECSPGQWVLWGASGTYMIGSFDGRTFSPSTPKLMNLNGAAYAAQCFNQLPEGRRPVKMAWGRISFPDMPFNGCMLLPQTQEIKDTPQGPRLYSYPIPETEQLFSKVLDKEDLTQQEANELMKPFNGNDVLRIRVTFRLTYATDVSLRYRGQKLFDYDMNGNRLQGEFYSPPFAEPYNPMETVLDLYVDRTIVEGYVDGGAFSYSFQRDVMRNNAEGYTFHGNQLQIKRLEVFTVS